MDDRQWFEQVYREYADFLFRMGRRLLAPGEDESALYDMIQDAFLALWNKRGTLRSHPNIGGWLVEALKFRVRNGRSKITRHELRHAYSLDEENAAPVADRALSPEQSAVLAGHMQAIVDLLGEENAELFIDYALRGYNAQALAQKNHLSVSCVWMRISRIKKKLSAHPELFYIFLLLATGFPPHAI